MEIWFNPACSKCRIAKDALDEAGAGYTVRRYLDDPPTAEELEDLLDRLGLQPWEIARQSEAAAEVLHGLPRERAAWVAALVAHPILIQRPIIVLDDGRAVIARDPDALRSAAGPAPA